MDVESRVKKLSLEQKLTLLTGFNAVCAGNKEYEGVGFVKMADGPYGVKTSDGNAVCFPNTCLMASSWDENVCREIGELLGGECDRLGEDLLLSPAVNIKRNPLCGRNFEYYSEDPLLTGKLAVAYVQGLKKSGTLVCAKHFAANNQETLRWTQNSVVDDDTLRNVYLKAFEILVKEGKVDSIMAAYNKLNGDFCTQNEYLLKDILRDEWGFDGVIMSDWCAISDVAMAFKNGLDLEMPENRAVTIPELKKALADGVISESEIDQKVGRIIALNDKVKKRALSSEVKVDFDRLKKITGEAFVLLKNQGALPIKRTEKVLVVGRAAKEPRIQGGGCAKLKTNYCLKPLDQMQKYSACDYCDYDLADLGAKISDYDKIVVFLSLPDDCDSEAFDRAYFGFPKEQVQAVEKLSQQSDKVVVVLSNGSAVDLSFAHSVNAILETYYAGSVFGGAVADVIFGETVPCGKLAETFPISYNDVPSNEAFADGRTDVVYSERQFVGYRYYESFDKACAYPFGFGLSYADISVNDVSVESAGDYNFSVKFKLKNLSDYGGKQTVQIYLKSSDKFLPKMQLIAFKSYRVDKHSELACEILLNGENFTYYAGGVKRRYTGYFDIVVATSVKDVAFRERVDLKNDQLELNKDLPIGVLLSDDRYRSATLERLRGYINIWAYGDKNAKQDFEEDVFLRNHVNNMPLRALTYFSYGEFGYSQIDEFIEELNKL